MKASTDSILWAAILSALVSLDLRAQETPFVYQGRVRVQGTNFHGQGQFKFALVHQYNAHRPARANVRLSTGRVIEFLITDGGAGYTSAPNVSVVSESGSGAVGAAIVSGGAVTEITVISTGTGYTLFPAPKVIIDPPPDNLVYVSHWSHNGSSVDGSEPTGALSVPVDDGQFMVTLGGPGQTPVSDAVFAAAPNLQLRIWFSDGVQGFSLLEPPHALTSTPFASRARVALALEGANVVASSNLAASAVTSSKIAASAVTSAQILDGTVRLEDLSAGLLQNIYWGLNGNGGTAPGTHYVGTTDNQPLELRVNAQRALRFEPTADTPNLIGGSSANSVASGMSGATIAGGGLPAFPNRIDESYATIGGGTFHIAAGQWSTIAGGRDNWALGHHSMVGGGRANQVAANSDSATIAGGQANNIDGNSSHSTVGGGLDNNVAANSQYATIPGGWRNDIGLGSDYSTVGGGNGNSIVSNAWYATIPGGRENNIHTLADASVIGGGQFNTIQAGSQNSAIPGGIENEVNGDYSLAAGRRAKALHSGTFVWADGIGTDFASSGSHQFLVRASGGVGIGTGSPGAHVHVRGDGSSAKPQMRLAEGVNGNPARLQMQATSTSTTTWELQANGGNGSFSIVRNGSAPLFSVDSNGETVVQVLSITGGADLAEPFPMAEEEIPKGSLVVIDETTPGRLTISRQAYDARVAGIVSGANGVNPGLILSQQGVMEGGQQVALTGRVYAWVDAAYGRVRPGDLLTTSDTPGHAMKVQDPARAHGAIVGKAMSPLDQGRGLVLVLVTLH